MNLCECAYSMHAFSYTGCFRDSECGHYLYNLSRLTAASCDCILVSPALFIGAFSVIPLCEFSLCKSLTIGPLWWYKGLRIKGACCTARQGWGGVTLTSTKTTLISNTCLCLPRPSLVSPWQHCALFSVAVETRRVHKLQTSLCSSSSLWKHLTHSHKSHLPCREKHYQLVLSWAEYISALHTLLHLLSQWLSLNSTSSSSCFCTSFSLEGCLALSVLNEFSMFGFEGWNQSAVSTTQLTLRLFCFCPAEWGILLSHDKKAD